MEFARKPPLLPSLFVPDPESGKRTHREDPRNDVVAALYVLIFSALETTLLILIADHHQTTDRIGIWVQL